jgi:hypothetical protein
MMTPLACSAMLLLVCGGEGGKLEISNIRPTYGYLGALRPLTGALPGENAHFSFDIKNLKLDEHGRAAYSLAIVVTDDQGNIFYEQKPYNSVAQNFFGGNSLPCSANLSVPLDTKPGIYHVKITIEDRNAKNSATSDFKGKVLEPGFGLIRVGTYADAEGRVPVPPVGVVGGMLYVNFATVGFGRDATTKQPDLQIQLRVLDDKGQPTFSQPLTGHVKEGVEKDLQIIPLQYGLTMNRSGNFTVELQADCHHCGKSATVRLPVRILSME